MHSKIKLLGAGVLAIASIVVALAVSTNAPTSASVPIGPNYSGLTPLTAACTTDPCSSSAAVSVDIPGGAAACTATVFGIFGAIWTSEESNTAGSNGSYQPVLLSPLGGGIPIGGGRLVFAGTYWPQGADRFRIRVTFYASGTVDVGLACVSNGAMLPTLGGAAPQPSYSASPTPGASPT